MVTIYNEKLGCNTSCRTLSYRSIAPILLTSSALVHQGHYTSRLQKGFPLTLLHVLLHNVLGLIQSSPPGWLILELQSSRLAVTFIHQSATLWHRPSPNLKLFFVLQDSSSRATFGQSIMLPSTKSMNPNLPLLDLHLKG